MIRQADRYSQYAEIILPLFRALQIIEPGTWLILTRHSKNLPSIILHYFKLKFQSAVLYFRMNVKIANFSAFIQEFRNWESAWALEALYVIVYEIRVLAEKVSNCLPA